MVFQHYINFIVQKYQWIFLDLKESLDSVDNDTVIK